MQRCCLYTDWLSVFFDLVRKGISERYEFLVAPAPTASTDVSRQSAVENAFTQTLTNVIAVENIYPIVIRHPDVVLALSQDDAN